MTGNGSKAKPLRYGAPADDSISGGDSPRGAGEEEAETHDDHDAHDTHNAPDAQGGHGPDTSDEPTIVPTTWRQLLIPLIILLFVGFLVAGPVMAAFAPKPA